MITETPGSLVELGVFASDKLNDDKLLIITDSKFAESESFINKGIFEYIRKSNEEAVKFYSLNSYKSNIDGSETPVKIKKDLAEAIFEDINKFIEDKLLIKSCKLDIKNKTHFFSLLIDSMILFRVMSKDEMVQLVEYINLHFLEDFFGERDIQQFLMLMRELDFVRLYAKGSNRLFYFHQDLKSISTMGFIYKKGKRYDRSRKMSQIFDFYEKKSKNNKWEKDKIGAIHEIYGSLDNDDELF